MVRKSGGKVKLLLVGVLVGLVIGVVLTVFYFSLATFFSANTKALEAAQKAAENRNENAEDASALNKMKAGRVGHGNSGLGREVHTSRKR
jgi:flagellar basal body-associated protein FliL